MTTGLVEMGARAGGMLGATSGTTPVGESSDATTPLLSGAERGIPIRAMPPPINATAGSPAQTLRQRTCLASTRLLFTMPSSLGARRLSRQRPDTASICPTLGEPLYPLQTGCGALIRAPGRWDVVDFLCQ